MKVNQKIQQLTPSATLTIKALAEKLKAGGESVISLAVGEPDFPPPQVIVEAAHQALRDDRSKYTPAAGLPELREKVAHFLNQEYSIPAQANQVVMSAGGKQSLHNVFEVLLEPGDEVLILCPWWVSYPSLIQLAGGVPVQVPMAAQGFLDIDLLEKAVTSKTRMLVINSPRNPSGQVITQDELALLEDFVLKHDLSIVSDELYASLVYGVPHFSPAARPKLFERTITIGGFSKCYAMTGWRLGYSVTSAEIAKAISAYQSHTTSNPNSVAQYAVLQAFEQAQESIETMRQTFDRRRQLVVKSLAQIPAVSCPEPLGAFYVFPNIDSWLEKKECSSDLELSQKILKELKVAVVPGSAFGTTGHLRVSYAASDEDLQEAMSRFQEYFS